MMYSAYCYYFDMLTQEYLINKSIKSLINKQQNSVYEQHHYNYG